MGWDCIIDERAAVGLLLLCRALFEVQLHGKVRAARQPFHLSTESLKKVDRERQVPVHVAGLDAKPAERAAI